jgi:hypothetical protein
MEPMPPINHVVLAHPTAIPNVAMLRDRMDLIVDQLKWIEKLVCVHSCCSVCSTNKVGDNISVCRCI